MRSVAVIVLPGFAPFEFGLACEAFGLDRSDDGIPNFDFRILTPEPGVVPSNLAFSINIEHDLSFAEHADIVVVTPVPRGTWHRIDERVTEVVDRDDLDVSGAQSLLRFDGTEEVAADSAESVDAYPNSHSCAP